MPKKNKALLSLATAPLAPPRRLKPSRLPAHTLHRGWGAYCVALLWEYVMGVGKQQRLTPAHRGHIIDQNPDPVLLLLLRKDSPAHAQHPPPSSLT